jgi:hypothetical protein
MLVAFVIFFSTAPLERVDQKSKKKKDPRGRAEGLSWRLADK